MSLDISLFDDWLVVSITSVSLDISLFDDSFVFVSVIISVFGDSLVESINSVSVEVEVNIVASVTLLVYFFWISDGIFFSIIDVPETLIMVEIVAFVSFSWGLDFPIIEDSISWFVLICMELFDISIVFKLLDWIDWLFKLIEVEKDKCVFNVEEELSILELINVEENLLEIASIFVLI